jgi:DNA-binding phage protein
MKLKNPPTRRKGPSKKLLMANKPQVLARFTPEQIAQLEKRASISDEEETQLKEEARQECAIIDSIDQLIRDLRGARLRHGLSLAQVDELTGIGRSNLARLENLHVPNPTLDTILRYAQAVGVRLLMQVVDERKARAKAVG